MFRDLCEGQFVVVGHRTAQTLPKLADAVVHVMQRDEHPADVLARQQEFFGGREVIIAGGAATYASWVASGLVTHSFITQIDYDGEADTFMPSLWRDHIPALMENIAITEFIKGQSAQQIVVGGTPAAKLFGTIAAHLVSVRERKWPWIKGRITH